MKIEILMIIASIIIVGFFSMPESFAEECKPVEIEYTTTGNNTIDFCNLPELNILEGSIDSSSGGIASIEVPRNVVDAVLGNCSPDSVFVLVNGIQVEMQETIMPTQRTIDVQFPAGDVKLEIVGSFPLVSPIPTQYCGSSHGYDSQYAPPLKQIKSEMPAEKVFCNEGKILIFKFSDQSSSMCKTYN